MAAKAAGHDVTVPFTPGRTDATQEQTEVDTFEWLEPRHDAFRNYLQKDVGIPTEHLMVDRAFMLNLTAPEMAALVGGMRAIGANAGDDNRRDPHRPAGSAHERLLRQPHLRWTPSGSPSARARTASRARTARRGETKWTATRVDLVYGSNSQLRAIAEEYAADGGEERMIEQFVQGWVKVMNNDRFDLHR